MIDTIEAQMRTGNNMNIEIVDETQIPRRRHGGPHTAQYVIHVLELLKKLEKDKAIKVPCTIKEASTIRSAIRNKFGIGVFSTGRDKEFLYVNHIEKPVVDIKMIIPRMSTWQSLDTLSHDTASELQMKEILGRDIPVIESEDKKSPMKRDSSPLRNS